MDAAPSQLEKKRLRKLQDKQGRIGLLKKQIKNLGIAVLPHLGTVTSLTATLLAQYYLAKYVDPGSITGAVTFMVAGSVGSGVGNYVGSRSLEVQLQAKYGDIKNTPPEWGSYVAILREVGLLEEASFAKLNKKSVAEIDLILRVWLAKTAISCEVSNLIKGQQIDDMIRARESLQIATPGIKWELFLAYWISEYRDHYLDKQYDRFRNSFSSEIRKMLPEERPDQCSTTAWELCDNQNLKSAIQRIFILP